MKNMLLENKIDQTHEREQQNWKYNSAITGKKLFTIISVNNNHSTWKRRANAQKFTKYIHANRKDTKSCTFLMFSKRQMLEYLILPADDKQMSTLFRLYMDQIL